MPDTFVTYGDPVNNAAPPDEAAHHLGVLPALAQFALKLTEPAAQRASPVGVGLFGISFTVAVTGTLGLSQPVVAL